MRYLSIILILFLIGAVPFLTAEELDLKEANVTDVSYEKREEIQYIFEVTLYHDDDGESGYADWWQVESMEGELLGRRDLLHAHGTRPFTRSDMIIIPKKVKKIVVRGHDQTHGYGGQIIIVDLETGEKTKAESDR
jgi:hypothetical protein